MVRAGRKPAKQRVWQALSGGRGLGLAGCCKTPEAARCQIVRRGKARTRRRGLCASPRGCDAAPACRMVPPFGLRRVGPLAAMRLLRVLHQPAWADAVPACDGGGGSDAGHRRRAAGSAPGQLEASRSRAARRFRVGGWLYSRNTLRGWGVRLARLSTERVFRARTRISGCPVVAAA